MKPQPIDSVISSFENEVEAGIQFAVSVLQNLSEDVLLKPAATGGWSIAHCIEHLNSYGRFYLPQIRNALDRNNLSGDFFSSSRLGAYFTKMMEPQSGKKYKAFKGHVPTGNLNAHEVISEFIKQQETMLQLLELSRKHDLNRVKIPLSIAPFVRLRLGDVYGFIIAHNNRHIDQAKRNL